MSRSALLVTGDRHASEKNTHEDWHWAIRKALGSLDIDYDADTPTLIIHGDARGIDRMAANMASKPPYFFSPIPVPANWYQYGKSAGPRRNQHMLALLTALKNCGYATEVFAFHDDWEHSKGTKDMIMRARRSGWDVLLWRSDGLPTVLSGASRQGMTEAVNGDECASEGVRLCGNTTQGSR